MVAKRIAQQRAKHLLDTLKKKYGTQLKDEPRTVLSQLMFNIVARNWSRPGAQKAFDNLREMFVDWNEVRISPVTEIEGALEAAGAPNAEKKAKNIKKILLEIYKDHHKITLDFIRDKGMKEEEAKEVLDQLPGVTPRVRDSVLLFALDFDVVPTYSPIVRVAKRCGIVDHAAEQDEIRKVLADVVPKKDLELFCRLLMEHGERICMQKGPKCPTCQVKGWCEEPERQKKLAEEAKKRAKQRAEDDKKRKAEEAKVEAAAKKKAEADRKKAEAEKKKAKTAKAKAAKTAKTAKAKAKTSKTARAKTSKTAKKAATKKTATKKKTATVSRNGAAPKQTAKKKTTAAGKATAKKATAKKTKPKTKAPAKSATTARKKAAGKKKAVTKGKAAGKKKAASKKIAKKSRR